MFIIKMLSSLLLPTFRLGQSRIAGVAGVPSATWALERSFAAWIHAGSAGSAKSPAWSIWVARIGERGQ